MTDAETRKLVVAEYERRYPKWQDVSVTEVVLDAFGGNLAVVRATTEAGDPNEEVCFAHPDGLVKVFYTTEELARFLEMKAKAPFLERMFTRPVFTGLVFSFLLIAVFVVGFTSKENFRPEVLTMLGSVLGGAAGFFFGATPSAKS